MSDNEYIPQPQVLSALSDPVKTKHSWIGPHDRVIYSPTATFTYFIQIIKPFNLCMCYKQRGHEHISLQRVNVDVSLWRYQVIQRKL